MSQKFTLNCLKHCGNKNKDEDNSPKTLNKKKKKKKKKKKSSEGYLNYTHTGYTYANILAIDKQSRSKVFTKYPTKRKIT